MQKAGNRASTAGCCRSPLAARQVSQSGWPPCGDNKKNCTPRIATGTPQGKYPAAGRQRHSAEASTPLGKVRWHSPAPYSRPGRVLPAALPPGSSSRQAISFSDLSENWEQYYS